MATKNQIAYQEMLTNRAKLVELQRSNLSNERITEENNLRTAQLRGAELEEAKRRNRVAEVETNRHNVATETTALLTLGEQNRHNVATEVETYRSNLARESETHRSNLAKEGETFRSNLAREQETHRSNVEHERQGVIALQETNRHNLASERIGATQASAAMMNAYTNKASQEENVRHNKMQESLATNSYLLAREQQDNANAMLPLQMTQTSAQIGKLHAETDKVREETQYVGVYGAARAVEAAANAVGNVGRTAAGLISLF